MKNYLSRALLVPVVLVGLLLSGCAEDALTEADLGPETASEHLRDAGADAKAGHATYEVTVTNLTDGQPLTPPLLVVHRKPVSLFEVGQPASFGLKEIAENGNLDPLMMSLADNKHVMDVQVGETGPLVPKDNPVETDFSYQTTVTISGERGAKYLSMASMLVCTNDGFTGVDGLRLPKKVGDTITAYTDGYDAGTEVNTEDFADIVPPCQGLIGVSSDDKGTGTSNPDLAEEGVIHHHPGVVGDADLIPDLHGWEDPVAKIEITRTY